MKYIKSPNKCDDLEIKMIGCFEILCDVLKRLDSASKNGRSPFATLIAEEKDKRHMIQLAVDAYNPGVYHLNVPELTLEIYREVRQLLRQKCGEKFVTDKPPSDRSFGYLTVTATRDNIIDLVISLLEKMGFSMDLTLMLEEFTE